MYKFGVDYFASDIDKPQSTSFRCLACGTLLKAEETTGYRRFVSALADNKTSFYAYKCPLSQKPGHDILIKLLAEIDQLVSEKLKEIVTSEYDAKRMAFMRMWMSKKQ
jgi:hypothetical protein